MHAHPLWTTTLRSVVAVGALAASPLSLADDAPPPATTQADEEAPPPPIFDDEAPPPAVVLRHVPANYSWDIGVHASYGMRAQFPGAQPWLGLGARGAWGKNFGDHRLGLGVAFAFEGEYAVLWSNIFTPSIQWDLVTPKGLYVGANLGPALYLNATLGGGFGYDLSFDAAPEIAARIGWSQRFSLVAKRFYVAVEPKLRIVDGKPSFLGAIVIGSGKGY